MPSMKPVNTSIVLAFILLSINSVSAQTSTTVDLHDTRPRYIKDAEYNRARQNEQVKRVVDQGRAIENRGVRRRSPREVEKETEADKQKAIEEINRILSTPPEYGVRYAEFLKGKKTGLARVVPDRGCDKGKTVSVKELERCSDTAPIWGAGSRYSFRLNDIPSDLPLWVIQGLIANSDIHFIDGKFLVGTKNMLDIIADIGDTDLANVDLQSDSLKFLKSFDPKDSREGIEKQRKVLTNGITENGFLYSTSATIVPDRTYVLRSIAFGRSPRQGQTYFGFWNTDTITAFRVVGLEKDGGVVLLWKELKESRGHLLRSW